MDNEGNRSQENQSSDFESNNTINATKTSKLESIKNASSDTVEIIYNKSANNKIGGNDEEFEYYEDDDDDTDF